MKRFIFVSVVVMFLSVSAMAEDTTVRWYQYQVEVADQVNAMVKAYAAEHPGVKIEPTVLGDVYWDQLKVRAAAVDMPDVFMTDGYSRIKTYRQYALDMTKDPLAANIVEGAKPAISLDGKIMGLPAQMSGWGVVYNKDLFAKAGVAIPKTWNELIKVTADLKSKGITPWVNQYKDAWLLGQLVGTAVGKIPNVSDFVTKANAGKAKLAEQEVLKRTVDILDLTLANGQKNPLNDGWNEACALMAQGKGAMMLEGIWVYDTIKSINPDAKVGLFALPFSNSVADTKLSADVNGTYHILANGKNVGVVKDLFNWLLNTPSGQKFFLNTGFIPAYKGLPSRLNDLGRDANDYIQAGKTTIWGWVVGPPNFQADSGTVFQEYILGKTNKTTVLKALDDLWAKLLQ